MFTITLKRPLGILAITAGLPVAAGSASASQVAAKPMPGSPLDEGLTKDLRRC